MIQQIVQGYNAMSDVRNALSLTARNLGNVQFGSVGGGGSSQRGDAARQREEQRIQAASNRPSIYGQNAGGGMSPSNSFIAAYAQQVDRADGSGGGTTSGKVDLGGDDPTGGGGGGGRGGRAALANVYLPRLQAPSEAELAKLVFDAVAAAQTPYNVQRQNLAAEQRRGAQSINQAHRDARSEIGRVLNSWRAATSGLEGRVGSAYQAAAQNLAANMSAANNSLLSRGFRPTAVNPEMLAALQGLGASAQSYATSRRMAGEDMGRDALTGVTQVTQASRGTLAGTYAQVLGQIAAQAAGAEAQARLGAENQIFALRQEIARLNNQTAIQEALANSGR
jgi:hypothetical protein